MTAIRIRALDHIVLRVVDVERSLRFYCDVLGCTEERRIEPLGLIQLRAGASIHIAGFRPGCPQGSGWKTKAVVGQPS